MPEDGPSVFVSYSREDENFAMKLAGDLKGANIQVWIDQSELKGGDPWSSDIEKALDACPRTLVILSPASVESRNVLNEVARALRKQNTVIPVLYLDCDIPLQLECSHHVDFRSDYDRGLEALLRDLGCDPAPPRRPAPGDQLLPEMYVATSGQRITGFLDTSQTSLVCIDYKRSRISEAAIASGAHFGLSNDRYSNLECGHGELDDSARLEFKAKYLRNFTEAARALRLLAEYRNRQEPLLGDASSGFEALYRATSNSELLQEFRDANVLPGTVQDWDIVRSSPELESPLRKFYVEWIGCLAPVFRLTVESGSVRSKVINGVTYAAHQPKKPRIKAKLEGAVAIPRYRLLIEDGFHTEPFNPPLEIPKDGSKTFDLAIELARPILGGVTYDLQFSFNCTDHTNFTLPPFAITFFSDEPESLS